MNQKGVVKIGEDAPSLKEEDFARINVTIMIPVDLLPMHDPVPAPAAPTESSLDAVANEPPPPPKAPSPDQVQRHTHVLPGADPPPAEAEEGGRVAVR